ncbi:LysM peptidoglycan-binding domain-containing protein [Pleomorphomonas sp. JP5]|uniref:LysM peptidoglycan-binding domain-containing protein n=1 Tax=Pleomorphomonas sp. JP5 TaxID=2942998 RepID=UPI002044039A|nr:LysM peptidoglycan-binding domain-containing protein [Pleomorphomonas sp. JP5]MCM5558348.1 LysM peptidoglycan-binding domain-containing protein [Pleomorphomonas sp. JP5]
MNKKLRTILIGAVGVIVVLLAGLFSGALDGVLRQLNIQLAGHPASVAETVASSDVVATPAPAKSDAPAAAAASPAETVVPIFDLVRVEPTGDAVIAGRSDPDAKVEILSGKDVVANGKANDTGSWAIVLADPLKPGAHDLSVRVVGKDGKVASSEQSVAVSVPEGGNGDVLVVLNQPGSPSTVLQVPGLEEAQAKLADAGVEPAEASDTQQVAAAEAPIAAPTPAVEPPTSASATATATAGNETTPATTAQPAEPITTEPAATPDVQPATVEIPAPPADMLAAAGTPGVTPSTEAPATATAQAEPPVADTPAAPAADSTAVASEKPAEAAPTAPVAEPAAAPAPAPEAAPAATSASAVTIDAVELENGNRFYAAGSAANGAVIRLYVDDKVLGDTKAEKGRWLYQGKVELAPGQHLVRIDQIGTNGAVIARAEVPFQIAEDGISAPTLASGVGSAQAGAGSAGEARPAEPTTLIIRRGDNLWMIAKRLYGNGIRYSTIYQANTDQIRNPDLIYPGQVFVIPESDAAWRPIGQ